MIAIQQNYERLREIASEDRLTHPQPRPRQPVPPPVAGKSSRTAEYEERLTNARSNVGNFKYLIVLELTWNGPKDTLTLHPFGWLARDYVVRTYGGFCDRAAGLVHEVYFALVATESASKAHFVRLPNGPS